MKCISIICLAFWAATSQAQIAFTAISNTNQPSANGNPFGSGELAAVSFTTQNSADYLVSISAMLSFENLGQSPEPLDLSLYSDAGGSPGSILTTLSGNSLPTTSELEVYTTTNPVLLSANTSYWLVVASPLSVAPFYSWTFTSSTNLDSGSLWKLGVTKYTSGGVWTLNPGAYLQFSATAVTTNLPPIDIYQPVVLTFPSYPYSLLQQKSNLASTNWVTATNAIQIATVSTNQTVFMVPPSGQQMFFRLSVQ